jgi:penicillin-binding protein 1A
VVGIAWIGFDQPRRMGSGETGGAAALPIWIGFMEHALKNVPESFPEPPEGLVTVVASDPSGKSGREMVYKESLPPVPAAESEDGQKQEPAPVVDAKPKPVEKAPEKPAAGDKAAAEKGTSEKPLAPKPTEKKN